MACWYSSDRSVVEQDIKVACGALERVAIAQASPATVTDGRYLMAGQFSGEADRYAFVKQDAHSSSGLLVQVGARQAPDHGSRREVLEEFRQ